VAVLVGTALVIASACVTNNYIDRSIDQKMTRTRRRPTATGSIGAAQALSYATVLGAAGVITLLIGVNTLTTLIGVTAWFIYVVCYGVAKRRSVHGTLIGSIAGAAPPVAGYTAATNQLDMAALLLFIILVCWQMAHFYAIAIYREKDYRAAGIPVLPIVRGNYQTKIQIVLYVIGFAAAGGLLTILGYTGYIFLAVLAVGSLWWLASGLRGFTVSNSRQWARQMFWLSLVVMVVLSVMLPLGAWLP
jgi:protoheme IX farnesyltransferase